MISLSNAPSHNAFYVDKNITSWYQDGSLWDRINGTNGYDEFEGIFPGCTFNMSRAITAPSAGGATSSDASRDPKIAILGCNSLLKNGLINNTLPPDYEKGLVYQMKTNHIVCCPYTHFGHSKMYLNANDTNNGYYNSVLHQQVIGLPSYTGNISGTINEQLYAEFGSHLKTVNESFPDKVDTTIVNRRVKFGNSDTLGATVRTSGNDYKLIQAVLMSEIETIGSIVFSSSGWDTGCAKTRFPAFFYSKSLLENSSWYWLKDISSATTFVTNGTSGIGSTSMNTLTPVRPRFILG